MVFPRFFCLIRRRKLSYRMIIYGVVTLNMVLSKERREDVFSTSIFMGVNKKMMLKSSLVAYIGQHAQFKGAKFGYFADYHFANTMILFRHSVSALCLLNSERLFRAGYSLSNHSVWCCDETLSI